MNTIGLFKRLTIGVLASVGLATAAHAQTYEITVKNLTYSQIFAPPIAVAHTNNLNAFEAGTSAGRGLEILAEDGSPAALATELELDGADVAINGDQAPQVIMPGESATFRLTTRKRNALISVLGMLVTTNDAFFGVDGALAPIRSRTLLAPAYDAGTEVNTEMCEHIPGPSCGNGGQENLTPGENGPDEGGVVHIHRGIHSVNTDGVDAAQHDWRNPVAEVTIRRIVRRSSAFGRSSQYNEN